jgi:hypothetical protein
MTEASFRRALQAFSRRQPFQPFLVEFDSGDRLTVSHPEAVGFRGEVIIYTSPNHEYRLFESTSICQLLDIPSQGS